MLNRLAHDRAGNTFAMIAAATVPLIALVGGGVDMGRSYLAASRLQQACDAGVLATRKKIGSSSIVDGNIPADAITVGQRFFNINYRDGAYGTESRSFTMTLEADYSVTGEASVTVPTTLMKVFGNNEMPVEVNCEAQLNFSNTDVMFVLDTTGSMADTNPGDSLNRIDSMRSVVKKFHAQVEGSKGPGTRIRYGFVPYSSNANVGHLLQDDWVVDEWTYQSRERVDDTSSIETQTDYANWVTINDGYSSAIVDTFAATWKPGTGEYDSGHYECNGGGPTGWAATSVETILSSTSEPYVGPPAGTKTIERVNRVTNGPNRWISLNGSTCEKWEATYTDHEQEFDRIKYPRYNQTWLYKPVTRDVSNWRSETYGCMEERSTYEIYTKEENVDTSIAFDLNIVEVPTPGNTDTQWRPMYPDIIYARKLTNENANNFHKDEVEYDGTYFKPASMPALVACPAPAGKLAEMDTASIDAYLTTLSPLGQTYHDIGMIWGGRLLAENGLFASENASEPGKDTSRHLIFLTDGKTEPLDIVYGAYGLEPLDERRWTDRPDPLLDRTIEMRFFQACKEVKKLNITVWVIGFGTSMNDVMKECAGDGHWYQADDAATLEKAFDSIAKSLAELRISK
ncbi:MAG: TadE/TadG family protein [Altererythrobacter sp.]